MKIGYARVSTQGQNLESQLEALKAEGCAKIYKEKASGAECGRVQLKKLLKAISEGDTLVITRLDRLARSTKDLLDIVDAVQAKGAGFRSIAEPWADTTSPAGKMMLTVLAGLAEFERSLISERTSEGRARAMANGVKFGRPHKLTVKQQREACAMLKGGKPASEIARLLNVSRSTVSRLV